MYGIRPSLTEIRERLPSSIPFIPHVFEIAQADFTRRDSTDDGTLRTLSRIHRAFINLSMAEAPNFHCCSHVFENLGERSIPSDHAAVRVVIQKPTIRCKPGQTHSELDAQTSRFLFFSKNGLMTITSTLTTNSLLWLTSKSLSRTPENGLFMSFYVRHRAAQAVDCCDSITSLQKQAPWHTHVML